MSRSVAPIARLLMVSTLLAGLVAVPTAVAGSPCRGHGPELPSSTTGTDTQIKLAPCAFAPTVAHVPAGSVVTFFNGPTFTHLITGANQEWGSPDVELEPGRTVAYRFDEPGIYPYACTLHPGMSGAIVVDLAAALPADTSAAGATSLSGAAGGADTGGAARPRTGGTADATTPDATLASLALVGSLAAGAGAVIGAAVAWFGARRRRGHGEAPVEVH